MSLTHILAFILLAFLPGRWLHKRGRSTFLLILSLFALYALQPALPIRGLGFYLPTLTLGLAILTWRLVTPAERQPWRAQGITLLLLLALVTALALTRFLPWSTMLLASLPPPPWPALAPLVVFLLLALLAARWRFARVGLLIALLGLFLILKTPALAQEASQLLRALNAQDITRAAASDIRWLGFSFIAFRLIHTLRDGQMGRPSEASLSEYLTYVFFFPTLTAGPIDRLERFLQELRRPFSLDSAGLLAAGERLSLGLLKKFVLADTLALIALNESNAMQLQTSLWSWAVVYAYAWQLYWDFSGYTDIALGLGQLFGIRLPENFNRPYFKPNLTQFWNNWHITLTQWFRAYFFNPLTRSLRKAALPVATVIFITQLSTMLLIGLWHGVSWNFALWGLWHGVGLFIHNRWSEWLRPRLTMPRVLQPWMDGLGSLLTFHYIALGWVFFALPTPAASWHVFRILLGGHG